MTLLPVILAAALASGSLATAPTRFTFDALGRTTSTTEANGATTLIRYTSPGPLSASALTAMSRALARGDDAAAFKLTLG